MTPEQISEQLNEITGHISDAYSLISQLGKSFDVAAKAHPAIDVVYSDIWADAGLTSIKPALHLMLEQLVRAHYRALPEHFERLQAGVA